MGRNEADTTREARLAAKLRENLHRRKTQARAAQAREAGGGGTHEGAVTALPKAPPKS